MLLGKYFWPRTASIEAPRTIRRSMCVGRVSNHLPSHHPERGEGRDRRLTVLRELPIKLFPEIRVGDERLGALLPDKFHRVAEPELVDDHRPFELRHPQRIRTRRRLVRQTLAVADLAHQAS